MKFLSFRFILISGVNVDHSAFQGGRMKRGGVKYFESGNDHQDTDPFVSPFLFN
jgi:hypothetical protein